MLSEACVTSLDDLNIQTSAKPLTARQRAVLDAIVQAGVELGRPPTFRQLMSRLGIRSPNGVMGHIKTLEAKGYLKPGDGRRYGVQLVDHLPVRAEAGLNDVRLVIGGAVVVAVGHDEARRLVSEIQKAVEAGHGPAAQEQDSASDVRAVGGRPESPEGTGHPVQTPGHAHLEIAAQECGR